MGFGDQALFTADSLEFGREVWATDGTTAGTQQLVDSIPGAEGLLTDFDPQFHLHEDTAYFMTGNQIWKTDGSPGNTELLLESAILGGITMNEDGELFALNDQGLVQIDTNSGQQTKLNDGLPSRELTATPLGIFYRDPNDELWLSQGDVGDGVFIHADPRDDHIIGASTYALFTANASDVGTELFVTDGTAAGTQLLKDLAPNGSINVYNMAVAGETVFFNASPEGGSMYATDGTTEGTERLGDAYSRPFAVMGDRVFFTDVDRIMSSGPTADSMEVIETFEALGIIASDEEVLFVKKGTEELFTSDGSVDGSELLMEIDLFRFDFVRLDNNELIAKVQTGGSELWASDRNAGTGSVFTDIGGERTSSLSGRLLQTFNNELIVGETRISTAGSVNSLGALNFLPPPPSINARIFAESFVTKDVLTIDEDLNQEVLNEALRDVVYLNGAYSESHVYFHSRNNADGVYEPSLWASDGTIEGTVKLRNLQGGQAGWPNMAPLGDGRTFFFSDGTRLFSTRGTQETTKRIHRNYESRTQDISGVGIPAGFIFPVTGINDARELWISDGSVNGTRQLLVPTDANDLIFRPLLATGDHVYFFRTVNDTHALWRTDGTTTEEFFPVPEGKRLE